MSIFGITAQEVKKKLVPFTSGDSTFSIGNDAEDDDMTEADCMDIVNTQEDRVLSYLPERYRKMVTHVDGEIAVKKAAQGQTSCRAALVPITEGSLRVFLNYASSRAWVDRAPTDILDSSLYTADLETGIITFSPGLNARDVVELEYDHGAAVEMRWLKECVIAYTAVEISRRFDYFATAEGAAGRIEAWENTTTNYLRDLGKSQKPGVQSLERVVLRGETRGKSFAQILG